jgi:hypothetical protein
VTLFDCTSPSQDRPLVPRSAGVNGGFSEIRTAYLGPAIEGWTLYVDDEPLERAEVNGRQLWEWRPGFYAGSVIAELTSPEGTVPEWYLLDVSPDPMKVGQEVWNGLLEDIREYDARLLFGSEPASTMVGYDERQTHPSIECSRLLQFGGDFIRALAAIRNRPHRVLRSYRAVRLAKDVRRVDFVTSCNALKSASAAALLMEQTTDDVVIDPADVLLDVPLSEDTFDSAANRTLLAVVRAVSRRAGRVIEYFQQLVERERAEEIGPRTPLARRWPRRSRRLTDLQRAIARAVNKDPLKSVTRPEVTAAGLTAIAAHPLYAKAYQIAWRMLRPGQAGGLSDEMTWMTPTWDIYERWCFVELAKALKATLADFVWTDHRGPMEAPQLLGLHRNRRIALRAQQTFIRNTKSTPVEFESISKELRPDFVLTVDEGDVTRCIVLDAKYTQGRTNILDYMQTAHIYHDALRRFGKQPELSLLLVPRIAEDVRWLEEKQYREKHGVGTVAFSRGDSGGVRLLSNILIPVIAGGGSATTHATGSPT